MVKKFLLEREVTEKLALYEQTKSKEVKLIHKLNKKL